MISIHHHLQRNALWYHRWHNHRFHPHTHWSVLGAFVVAVAVTFVGLGWIGYSYGVPYVAFAQSTITINAGIQHQTIEGFGAAVDVNKIDWTQADKGAMADKAVNDLGISSIRWGGDNLFNKIEQTGNDSSGYVKENDNNDPNVVDSAYFSDKIDQEFGSQIAYMKEFQNRGANRLQVSMWKPAVWLRRNDASGQCDGTTYNGGDLCIPEQADELAEHVSATLQTLKMKGLNVTWFSPVNEPDYQPGIPSGSGGMASVLNVFSSRFSKDGLNVSLVAPETAGIENASAWPYSSYANIVSHIDVHGYVNFGDPEGALPMYQTFRSAMQPLNKPIMQTEFSNFWGAGGDMTIQDTFQEALFTAQHIHYQLTEAHINLWMWWSYMNSEFGSNIDASDPPIGRGLQCRNGPPPGVCDGLPSWQCGYYCVAPGMRLVWVRPANRGGGVFYSPKYFAMKRFSRFIPVGSKRYDVSGVPGGALVSAYGHTNGTFTIVAINTSGSPKQLAMNVVGGSNVSSLNKYITSEPCELDSMNTSSSYSMSSASFNGCDQSGGTISVSGGSFTDTIPPQSIVTYSTMTDTTPLPHDPVCGDGVCNGTDTKDSCPSDCSNTGGGGSCGTPGSQCSVGSCAGTCDSSGNQCVKSDPSCGNTGGGSAPNKPNLCYCPNGSCPAQCTGTGGGGGPMCGQNGCEPGETAQSCPADCGSGPTCNNNRTCDPGETTTNCPADCPPAQVCTPNQSCKYTSQDCAGVCNAQGTLCSDADANDGCPNYPPITGLQPFPHVAAFTWGGAVPWYDARFDLMMTSANSTGWADARKSLNPSMILLTTRDINGGADIWKTPGAFPEAAWVHTSKGQTATDRCLLYSGDTFLANYTNYAPPVFSGQRYNVYVGDWFAQIVPRPAFDGYASDGLWPGSQVCTDDIDLNANGVNDYSEGIDVDGAFREGAEVVSANLRRTAGDAFILLNSGGWDDAAWQYKDGMVSEHASIGQENIDWWWWIKDQHDAFAAAKSGRPIALLMDGNATAAGYGGTPSPTKNDFQFMRFGLTLMSLNNGYFSMADAYGGESHNYVDYYDEFDVNLGLPTGADQEILPHVYARFFQYGAVIHNSSASSVTVTNSQLSALSGYAGPYYRFLGGQDPTVNNGQLFDSVTLNMRQLKPYLGDGIILVKDGLVNGKSQRVVVSDIVVDNVESGTSPGSTKATLGGFSQLQSDCDKTATDYYTVRCVVSDPVSPDDSQPVATSSNVNAVAQFTPSIGVAGKYNVYEWHGQINGDCTSVPISTQGMSCSSMQPSIDQSVNWGKWNPLGQCILSTGNTSGITLTAPGNCIAQADAFRFEYVP